ncbi:hypothetical protein [Fictibacillus gelatini]|uniref:hypothetical protein n=1 Tax=Fictibacillus gelatini TaxID=225985 RepID=UPI000421AA1C|nr:hypothetical protein [Fictibacillus gelatini]
MDVKYIAGDWEKMKEGIGDLIGLGHWGKGMIDTLKDITDNLEDAQEAIEEYDSDRVISFQHTSLKNKYQELFEDFDVLHTFAGNVGDIVDRTIDDPFYKDMDAFVEAMRNLTPSNYTTTNRIGATETKVVYGEYGTTQSFEVKKKEISLDDLFNGDNFYAKQIKSEYEAWKVENPDEDLSKEDYQKAIVNMHAFKYESIKDQQESKEFWVQLGALVVIVGATLICPPAGMALGAVYGTMELSSAVSGKDWVSGRELGTKERWIRGLMSPLDIVPGVNSAAKFSNTVRIANRSKNLSKLGVETGLKADLKYSAAHVGDLVKAAREMSFTRLRNAKAVVRDWSKAAVHKVAKDAVDVGKLADNAITKVKNANLFPGKSVAASNVGDMGKVSIPAENTHAVENKIRAVLSKIDGINLGYTEKFASNVKPKPKLKTINHGFETQLNHSKLPQGKGFAAEIDHVLGEIGMTKDEFFELQAKHHTELTPSQLEKMRQVRDSVPSLNKDSVLQKVIPLERLDDYLSGEEAKVGGCVARIEDVADITTSSDVYYSLRMDYEGTPFSPSKEYAVIRFKTDDYEKFGIPFAEELNHSKSIKPNEYITYPQTGHGFTAAENSRIVPEFETKYRDWSLPTVGEIYIVKDGTEELVGLFDKETKRFYNVKELSIND